MKKTIIYILLGISFLSSLGYLGFAIFNGKSFLANLSDIISALILFLFSIIFVIIGLKITKNKGTVYVPIAAFLLTGFMMVNVASGMGFLGNVKTVKDLTKVNISEALKWAKANNIEIEQQYEHSDLFKEFIIISQDIKQGTSLKDVKKINLIVSSGPDYNKTIIVPNMLGWNADDVLKFINDNYLTNVNATFKYSEQTKDIVIEQDKNGEIKRSDALNLTLSWGAEGSLAPVKLIDLTKKSLFEATFWLKRNGILFNTQSKFDNTIKKNFVIEQSVKEGQTINPQTDAGLILTISKGKQITVPDLMNMKVEDIMQWVTNNNLKISFSDRYDEKIVLGKIIEVNYKKGDIIEEGTLITIAISKGQLKMPNIKTVYELREWATKYQIAYEEEYEYSDTIASGNIIKLSHKINDIILDDDKIVVTISQGKPSTIPNFSGKTKDQATSLCRTANLKCSFTYGSYSSTVAKDIVTAQSKRSGAQVISGSSIVLTLSKGRATSYEFNYQESWLKIGDANGTITSLRSAFATRYPGVTFNFIKTSHNTLSAGLVHPDSPTNIGSTVVQGQTYNVWIVSN